MPKIPNSLKASLLAIAIAGGGYQEMTRETLVHVEGIEYYPYRDVAGVLTVCVGHTGADIQMRTYSHDECMALLDSDLKPVHAAIKRLVKVPLTDYQRTALATFVFNTGIGAFTSSTLLKKLNTGDFQGARDQMQRWVFAGGKKWKGLMTRREVEMAIWSVTLSNVVLVVYGAVSILALVGFAVALDKEKEASNLLRQDLQTQTQARNTAEWLLHSQEQTLQIFSAIRVANAAARRDDEAMHNDAQQQITASLSNEDCAKRMVPDAAAEWLQRLETRARAGGGNTAGH